MSESVESAVEVERPASPRAKKNTSARLYVYVLIAAVLGVALGLVNPEFAKEMKPLATGFIALVKMMIVPIIFCTIVLGIGSIAKAATVGKIGGMALTYFLIMSLFALTIGMIVGNIIKPGVGLDVSTLLAGHPVVDAGKEAKGTVDFLLAIIPKSLLAPFADGSVLPGLFVALLVGFAIQGLGERGKPALEAITTISAWCSVCSRW